MKMKKICGILVICLLLCGCKKEEKEVENKLDERSMKIVGEWKLDNSDYFEFFNDGTFERTCTNYLCSMVVRSNDADDLDKTCVIKGTFKLEDTNLHLNTKESNCNLEKEEFIYGFDSELEYFCANPNAVCSKGWKKNGSTPYHLDSNGARLN